MQSKSLEVFQDTIALRHAKILSTNRHGTAHSQPPATADPRKGAKVKGKIAGRVLTEIEKLPNSEVGNGNK